MKNNKIKKTKTQKKKMIKIIIKKIIKTKKYLFQD